eukprot:1162139-Pelagomonas_calceolata.AAC.2
MAGSIHKLRAAKSWNTGGVMHRRRGTVKPTLATCCSCDVAPSPIEMGAQQRLRHTHTHTHTHTHSLQPQIFDGSNGI